VNLGPDGELISRLGERFTELRRRHGQKLSLIGWSLGGIYARELARHFADDVRQVITLASPFRDVSATSVSRLARSGLLRRRFPDRGRHGDTAEVRRRMRVPPPVPSTAFYSRTDGIVAWRSCLEDETPGCENVEVWSSHCGMGHHPSVLIAIAERLARAPG
jgi:pimeloyl-ACP methyl ester carboxylesterase